MGDPGDPRISKGNGEHRTPFATQKQPDSWLKTDREETINDILKMMEEKNFFGSDSAYSKEEVIQALNQNDMQALSYLKEMLAQGDFTAFAEQDALMREVNTLPYEEPVFLNAGIFGAPASQ